MAVTYIAAPVPSTNLNKMQNKTNTQPEGKSAANLRSRATESMIFHTITDFGQAYLPQEDESSSDQEEA